MIESLLAIAILAAVALAAFAGLDTAIDSTVRHRDRAEIEALARSSAEAVEAQPFANCASAEVLYEQAAAEPAFQNDEFDVSVLVDFAAMAAGNGAFVLSDTDFGPTCSDSTTVLQRVQITIEPVDGEPEPEVVTVVKAIGS